VKDWTHTALEIQGELLMLRGLVARGRELEERGEEDAYLQGHVLRAFSEMLDRMETGRQTKLSDKQRAWVKSVYERVFEQPVYENLVSRGLVPRGREVATPEVLKNLPLKPPRRKS